MAPPPNAISRSTFLKLVLTILVGSGILFLAQDSEWLELTDSNTKLQTGVKNMETTLPVSLRLHSDDKNKNDVDASTHSDAIIATITEEGKDEDDDDDEEDRPDLVAPRSYEGPYDEYIPGQRYLIYSPSGGFSNQRMEIEYAVEIGKLLNRTVYVPMCGRHTNGWSAYTALKEGEDLFPMDRILDFPYVTTYDHRTRLVPLNMTVSRFIGRFQKKYGEDSVLIITGSKNFYGREQIVKWRQYKHPIMFFRGPGFFHPWFPQSTMTEVRKHVRFTKYLRDLSIKITKAALGDNFYAMHIRMGDYAYRRVGDATPFVTRARDLKWKIKEFKTYVATEPNRDAKFFEPMAREMRVVYSSDLPKELVKDFKNAFPKGKIRGDMMGLLEQLIAAQSKSFLGTYFSTFSGFILFMRQYKQFVFPELVNMDTSGDGSAGDDSPEAQRASELEATDND